ncbi:hypothetical protein U1Q18_028590 [Sarracenia purpurea var. burkii]
MHNFYATFGLVFFLNMLVSLTKGESSDVICLHLHRILYHTSTRCGHFENISGAILLTVWCVIKYRFKVVYFSLFMSYLGLLPVGKFNCKFEGLIGNLVFLAFLIKNVKELKLSV